MKFPLHSPQAIPRSAVALLLVASLAGYSSVADAAELLRTGIFRSKQVSARDGEVWVGVFPTVDGYRLSPTVISVEEIDAVIGYGIDKRVTVEEGEPVFLVKGIAGLSVGPVETTFDRRRLIYPGEGFAVGKGRILQAFGNAVYYETLPNGLHLIRDYTLRLRSNDLTQTIVQVEKVSIDGTPELVWVGDVDRDGHMDILVDATERYTRNDYRLFLSSLAGPGELVHQVASSGHGRLTRPVTTHLRAHPSRPTTHRRYTPEQSAPTGPPLRRTNAGNWLGEAMSEVAAKQPIIRPFATEDQKAVHRLIINGLAEHWRSIDPTLNPDLKDIGTHYNRDTFLVASLDGEIIGSGALVRQTDQIAEIVRMSVAPDLRRRGIATSILRGLYQEAQRLGFHRIVLETTSTWHEVIQFYLKFGFRITHHQEGPFGGETHLALDVEKTATPTGGVGIAKLAQRKKPNITIAVINEVRYALT